MLEESAAQLAALRQRAEYLLEQLAASPGTAPSPASTDGKNPGPARLEGDQQRVASETGQNDGSDPDKLPESLPLQNLAETPNTSAPSSDTIEREDRALDLPGPSQASPRLEIPPGPDAAPLSESFRQPPQALDQSAGDDLSYSQSGQDQVHQPEPLQQQFPIQNYQPQSDSLLDNPVTVAPPPDWLKFEVAPEFLTEDAQLIEEEIVHLYEAIDRFRETRRENTGHALSLLREAREIIAGQPHRIERAQYNIEQAKLIVERARSSRRRSRGVAFRTFGLLILWLAGLGGLGAALYLYPLHVNAIIGQISSSTGWNTTHYYPLLWTVATGGIGGCLGTISFLFERMRVHEEFDRQYVLRSMIQPLMGVILGLIAYGLLASLFNGMDASIIGHPLTKYLPAALALPIGLWQVYVYAAIFRITRLLTFQRRRRW